MKDKKTAILKAVEELTDHYRREDLFLPTNGRQLPNRAVVIDIVKELRPVVFPGYFGIDSSAEMFPEYYVGSRLNSLYDRLKEQIEIAFLYENPEGDTEEISRHAEEVCAGFFEKLPEVQNMLLKDVQAGFDGDPAAKGKEEIIVCYPGLMAIYVYRLAHILYVEKVPHIPRIMTAQGLTIFTMNSTASAMLPEKSL